MFRIRVSDGISVTVPGSGGLFSVMLTLLYHYISAAADQLCDVAVI